MLVVRRRRRRGGVVEARGRVRLRGVDLEGQEQQVEVVLEGEERGTMMSHVRMRGAHLIREETQWEQGA